jgi:hypothetical protein
MNAKMISLAGFLLVTSFAEAQQRRRRPRIQAPAASAPAAADTAKPAVQAVASNPVQQALDSIRRVDSLIVASGYDPLSVRKVHVSDVMYKMQVWRVMDLREKCNQPFLR